MDESALDRLGRINVSGHAFLGEDRVDLLPHLIGELPSYGLLTAGSTSIWKEPDRPVRRNTHVDNNTSVAHDTKG